MFKGLKSDSIARGHVCLGRPTGRLQSGGGFRVAVAAETAR